MSPIIKKLLSSAGWGRGQPRTRLSSSGMMGALEWATQTWVQILAPPLPSCVTWGKFFVTSLS